MLDLGSGKGALLIQLAGRFGWTGRGIETAWSLPQYSCKGQLTESDMRQSLERSRVHIIDTELLDSDWVKAQNARNTSRIRSRAEVLASREPDLKHLVDDYLWVQEEECRLLEEQAQCVALLLSAGSTTRGFPLSRARPLPPHS